MMRLISLVLWGANMSSVMFTACYVAPHQDKKKQFINAALPSQQT